MSFRVFSSASGSAIAERCCPKVKGTMPLALRMSAFDGVRGNVHESEKRKKKRAPRGLYLKTKVIIGSLSGYEIVKSSSDIPRTSFSSPNLTLGQNAEVV